MITRVAFTGHRDKLADPECMRMVGAWFANATWVLGGAKGFDAQADGMAISVRARRDIHKPDYRRYGRNGAPLQRNRAMVDGADLLIACYDGRTKGGTAYTIAYAQSNQVPILLVPAECDAVDLAAFRQCLSACGDCGASRLHVVNK